MKPVLFELTRIPGPLVLLLIWAAIGVGVLLWLGWLARHKRYTRDHLFSALGLLGVAAIMLVIVARIGHLRVNAYGAMLMVGFIAGIGTGVVLARRRGIATDRILDLGLVILLGAILGARVAYVLQTHEPFLDLRMIAENGLGGLSFHGGLMGGILAAILYSAAMKLAFWRVADTLSPGLALGYAITRIGCFLNGCCYGKPAPQGLPWAMDFPFALEGPAHHVHPTQLYAMLMGLAMFGILLLLARGASLGRAGRLFMAFLMLEGVERFVMELFRQPDPRDQGVLTMAQVVSVLLIAAGAAGWFLLKARPAVDAQPAPIPATGGKS